VLSVYNSGGSMIVKRRRRVRESGPSPLAILGSRVESLMIIRGKAPENDYLEQSHQTLDSSAYLI